MTSIFILPYLSKRTEQDYTITYFPLFSALSVVPEQGPSCSTSPSYPLVSRFVQLYLYRLLLVSLKESSPMLVVHELTLIDRTHWFGFLLAILMLVSIASFPGFLAGCDQISRFQPLSWYMLEHVLFREYLKKCRHWTRLHSFNRDSIKVKSITSLICKREKKKRQPS